MKMKRVLVATIGFIISKTLIASPTCSQNGTVVYYTNGVNTKKSDAQAVIRKIESLGIDSQIDSKEVKFFLKHNFHADGARDVLEAALQRFPESYLNSIKMTKWEAYTKFMTGDLSLPDLISSSIQQEFLEKTKDFIETRADIPQYHDTVREISEAYDNALAGTNNIKSKRVLAISHSQGGLFMNDAYEQISFDDKQKYFAGFQIATPVNEEVINHFGYQTHEKDRVIAFVRETVGALPANMNTPLVVDNHYNSFGDYVIDFIFNHGIATTYLYDINLRPQIINSLIETAQKLESNCGKPPVAQFNASSRAGDPFRNPMVYDLDGSISTDEDTPVVPEGGVAPVEPPDYDIDPNGFEWKIDNTYTLNGMNPVFQFQHEGSHTIQLIVTDLEGNKSEPLIKTIQVVNRAPIGNFRFTVDGLRVSFDATDSIDLDGIISDYFWDFGDGQFSNGSKPSHSYVLPGTYTVTLKVKDNNGKESSIQQQVTVESSAVGCFVSGVSAPGKWHQNPDGSQGGFVANSAQVDPSVVISEGAEVCDGARISGNVFVGYSKVSGNSVLSGNLSVGASSEINNSNISSVSHTMINTSKMNSVTISINQGGFAGADITGGSINGQTINIFNTKILNTNISGNYINMMSFMDVPTISDSTIQATYPSGLVSLDSSTIIGSTIIDSTIMQSTVTASTLVNAFISREIITGYNP